FSDPDGESAALVDETGSYDCFGGPGIVDTSLVAGWAPGGGPFELPSNPGMLITKGTKLVVQIHHHPARPTADPDATTFQMRFRSGVPEYQAVAVLAGNFENPVVDDGDGLLPGDDDPNGVPTFLIPANAKNHVENMQFSVPANTDGSALPELYLY